MKYRKLRIAWSVVWGILCVLLIVLWVRGYSTADGFAGMLGQQGIMAHSDKGWLRASMTYHGRLPF